MGVPFTIGIHHPSGDVKKISKDTNPPTSINHPNITGCPTSNIAGTHWQVIWDEGVTEGGSSGSPLFNSDHKIIGQLHGGSSSCSDPSYPDLYGKFSYSYTQGNFAQWLDPYRSGATSMGDYNPSQVNDNCYNGIQDGNETGIDCGGSCPPCAWVNSGGGWSNNHCKNGIKDSGETGVDCGGTCKPCITVIQCNNCIKDGNETRIDCGGSCPPCSIGCTHTNVIYNSSDNMPTFTAAAHSIEACNNTKIQPGQNIIFKAANSITLGPGFRAMEGCTFSAFIAPCVCIEPCDVVAPNVFTPNGDGVNDNLCYSVSGYNRYSATGFNRWGNTVFQIEGKVENNIACIWNGSNSSSGAYYTVITTFYSDCTGKSKTYNHSVTVFKSNADTNEAEQTKTSPIQTSNGIVLYPNPTSGLLNIYQPVSYAPIIMQIFDTLGKLQIIKEDIRHITSIDLSFYPKGIYFVKTVSEELGTSIDKIIIK